MVADGGEGAEAAAEDVDRYSKRTVKMDSTHIEDCKRLLRLSERGA